MDSMFYLQNRKVNRKMGIAGMQLFIYACSFIFIFCAVIGPKEQRTQHHDCWDPRLGGSIWGRKENKAELDLDSYLKHWGWGRGWGGLLTKLFLHSKSWVLKMGRVVKKKCLWQFRCVYELPSNLLTRVYSFIYAVSSRYFILLKFERKYPKR